MAPTRVVTVLDSRRAIPSASWLAWVTRFGVRHINGDSDSAQTYNCGTRQLRDSLGELGSRKSARPPTSNPFSPHVSPGKPLSIRCPFPPLSRLRTTASIFSLAADNRKRWYYVSNPARQPGLQRLVAIIPCPRTDFRSFLRPASRNPPIYLPSFFSFARRRDSTPILCKITNCSRILFATTMTINKSHDCTWIGLDREFRYVKKRTKKINNSAKYTHYWTIPFVSPLQPFSVIYSFDVRYFIIMCAIDKFSATTFRQIEYDEM